jgi:HlyD family secretion protein
VYVVRDERAVVVPIEVGLMNDVAVEILSGVEEGEPVVVAPDSDLTDGLRVEVR